MTPPKCNAMLQRRPAIVTFCCQLYKPIRKSVVGTTNYYLFLINITVHRILRHSFIGGVGKYVVIGRRDGGKKQLTAWGEL